MLFRKQRLSPYQAEMCPVCDEPYHANKRNEEKIGRSNFCGTVHHIDLSLLLWSKALRNLGLRKSGQAQICMTPEV